jgi:hypothetical protein
MLNLLFVMMMEIIAIEVKKQGDGYTDSDRVPSSVSRSKSRLLPEIY